jgi:hypothetical protein
MASTDPGGFQLSHLPGVSRRVKQLGDEALQAGVWGAFADAISYAYYRLQTDPIAWGDPEYHPKKPGSTVLHAVCFPLFFQYVVFEPERKVMLMTVKWFTEFGSGEAAE